MIAEALKEDEAVTVEKEDKPIDIKDYLRRLQPASSISCGITFAFLQIPVIEAIMIIGLTTFGLSIAGVYIGNIFGNKYEKKAELAGGVILILIGLKILLEHLGVLVL